MIDSPCARVTLDIRSGYSDLKWQLGLVLIEKFIPILPLCQPENSQILPVVFQNLIPGFQTNVGSFSVFAD